MEEQQITKKVVSGILQFLDEELKKGSTTADQKEGLEVAIQCLETSYGVGVRDAEYRPKKGLRELVADQEGGGGAGGGDARLTGNHSNYVDTGPEYVKPGEASDGDKAAAEVLKNQGNDAMMRSEFLEGLDCYTKAIALDGNNPVYFCNRSAAYIKLEKFEEARRDCQIAIQLQPSYAKAYGRMGLAYSSQNKHVDAILCYRSALELDPENETYTKNLKVAQQMMVQDIPSATAQATVSPNLEGLLRNQNLVNAASQMLQDPNVMQLMQNLMRGNQGGDAGGGGAGGMESLVQIGQAIAQRFGNSNGNLLDQLAGLGASVGRGANQPANGQPENEDSSGEDRGSN